MGPRAFSELNSVTLIRAAHSPRRRLPYTYEWVSETCFWSAAWPRVSISKLVTPSAWHRGKCLSRIPIWVSPDAFWKRWWWGLEICISIQHHDHRASLLISPGLILGFHPHQAPNELGTGNLSRGPSVCSVRHLAAASHLYKASTTVTLAPAEPFNSGIKTRILNTKPSTPTGPLQGLASAHPPRSTHTLFPALSLLQAKLSVQVQ